MDPSKQSFINAFFSTFKQKIDRLQELRKVYPDEAFTLAQLTGNPLFGMIHPRQLEELTQRYYPSAVPFISSLPHRYLETLGCRKRNAIEEN
jgi:hypothetical protein